MLTKEEIKYLVIEDVIESTMIYDGFSLCFTNRDVRYFMAIERNPLNDRYFPTRVVHLLHESDESCPYCLKKAYECSVLMEHKHALFERVIASNSIRLNWLYREYEIQ